MFLGRCLTTEEYEHVCLQEPHLLHDLCTLNLWLAKYCIPESFNTNSSYQLFDYIITFVNP